MKVLVDGFFFQLARSGIARVWLDLLEHWTTVSPDIEFYFLNREQDDIEIEGVEILQFPKLPIEQCFEVWNLDPWYSDRDKIDKICTDYGIDLFMSTYYTYSTVCTNVLYIHDCIPEVFPDIYNMDEPIWKLKIEGIYHSHAYICVSQNSANDLFKFYEVTGRPAVVAENAVSKSFFKTNLDIPADSIVHEIIAKPFVIIPGLSAADSYKNQLMALKASSIVRERTELNIVCTGGSAKHHLPEYKDVVDIDTVYCSNFTLDELVFLYNHSAAVLYPSLYEGFGLPLVEAFATGAPVITCANSSLTEVGGDLAVYTDPNNEIEMANRIISLINADSNAYSKIAIERARNFNWSKTTKKVDSFARQLHLETKHSVWMKSNGFI